MVVSSLTTIYNKLTLARRLMFTLFPELNIFAEN